MATGDLRGRASTRPAGRHAGARREARAPRGSALLTPALLVGVVLAALAWGFLVWSAIGFGRAARGGDHGAWWFLTIASVGAVGCLFLALVLAARLLRRWGITRDPALPDRPSGGRRIRR